jgi:RNA recognition motif-containing protein
LRYYFERYGKLIDVALMKNKLTGQPRGFGFVTFENPEMLTAVLDEVHTLDHKTVEVKRAVPREKTAGAMRG